MKQDDIDIIASHFDFSKLQGKRVLVTGGTGFVGHWLRAVPHDVYQIYFCGTSDYKELTENYTYDYIIHCAPVGVEGVVRCASKNGATILYTSSGAVKDDPPTELAQSKLENEMKLLDSGLPVKIARLYTFSGEWLDPKRFALARWIHDGLGGAPIEVWGSGNQTRSYMYGADMAAWLWTILVDGKPYSVYNVGSEVGLRIIEVAQYVAKELGVKMVVLPGESEGDRPVYVPDTFKTRQDLKLDEWTGWQLGILKMIGSAKIYQPSIGDL